MSNKLKRINICSLNCNSVYSNMRKAQLNSLILDMTPHFLLLQETGLFQNNILSFKNYKTLRTHKNDNTNRGTAIVFQKRLELEQIFFPCIKMIQYTAAKFILENEDILVMSLYIPNNIRLTDLTADLNELERITQGQSTIIGGDLNAREASWDETGENPTGKRIRNWMETVSDSLTLMSPTEATFRTGSILDHFIVSTDLANSNEPVSVVPTFSDHNMIQIILHPNRSVDFLAAEPVYFKDYSKANWTKFRMATNIRLKLIDVPIEANKQSIDRRVQDLTDIVYLESEKHIPLREHDMAGHSILDKATIALMKYRRLTKKLLMRENKKVLGSETRKSALRNEIAQYTNLIEQRITIELRQKFKKRIERIATKNMEGGFFQEINRITGRKRRDFSSALEVSGVVTSDHSRVAEEFARFYKELYRSHSSPGQKILEREENCATSDSPKISVDPEEIGQIVMALNGKKSSGPDGISNAVLKKLPPIFHKVLADIVNKCLSIGYFPVKWKEATIIPIKKKKGAVQAGDFRPISMTNNIGKILEQVMLNNMRDRLDEITPEYQFGFRRGHSTTDAICLLGDRAKHNFDNRRVTAACFLDVEKAFDSVWKEGLQHKVRKSGISTSMINIVCDFLEDRTARVLTGKTLSDSFEIQRGVPQGTVLGPQLYSLFTSDMPEPGEGVNILQFADDLAVTATNKFPVKATKMVEEYIQKLSTYYNSWGIKINKSKTQLMVIRPKSKDCIKSTSRKVRDLKMRSAPEITTSKCVKYLGVIIDEKLTFRAHRTATMKKIKMACAMLRPLYRRLELDMKVKEIVYKQLIRPIMLYGLQSWFQSEVSGFMKPLEIQERKIIRSITGRYRHPDTGHYFRNEELYEGLDVETLDKTVFKTLTGSRNRTLEHVNRLVRESERWALPQSKYPKSSQVLSCSR